MSTRRKSPAKLGTPKLQTQAKLPVSSSVKDTRTIVSKGGRAANLPPQKKPRVYTEFTDESSSLSGYDDSEEEEEEDDDDDDDDNDDDQEADEDDQEKSQLHDTPDVDMLDATAVHEEDPAEPSFGDLVRAQSTDVIDVAAAFPGDANTKPVSHLVRLPAPSGASMGTVLTQALRTNDVTLLESCLHTRDVATIRATIQRLESPLASLLLHKLAARLHRKPGRAGSLLIWVQWTLVAHGGYLATQKDLVKKLAELHQVISDRARSLNSLLALKGKLDMLEAQIELRKNMQLQHRRTEGEEEDAVIYVEGEESNDDRGIKLLTEARETSDMHSEVSEEMGFQVADNSDEDDQESSDGNLVDDEASETDNDSGDDEDIDHDDIDSMGEPDESEDDAPPPRQRIKRR